MKRLVVARWREDTSWVEHLPDWQTRIVQKESDLPNLGREPSSFLWAIGQMYDDLTPDAQVGFVQGNPFDHCPDLLDLLARPTERYQALGNWHTTSDAGGAPHHHGLSVGRCWESWLDSPFPGTVEFTAGGQFLVTGAAIRSRPAAFYARLYDEVMQDAALPYVLERLWPAVFA